jgi:type II secretory pathway pseudopilin PulG
MKAITVLIAATLAALLTPPVFAHGDAHESAEKMQSQIAEVRRATRKYFDVQTAVDAGYAPFADKDGYCVSQPGQGGMGNHYLNGGLVDAVLDPLKPEALMYETNRGGKLELVGVEYIVFQDAWDAANPQPPVLFGHPFHLVRAPNRYNVPAFYELHLWIWEHNRNGLFNDWNPSVRCP